MPNITGKFTQFRSTNYSTMGTVEGCFDGTSLGGANTSALIDAGQKEGAGNLHAKFDASKSNSIYGNSTTVQPLSVNCYLEFYIN